MIKKTTVYSILSLIFRQQYVVVIALKESQRHHEELSMSVDGGRWRWCQQPPRYFELLKFVNFEPFKDF